MIRLSQNRLRRRLVHHVVIGVASVGLTFLFMQFFPKRDLVSRLGIGTAYPALILMAAALVLGPFNVLLRRSNPVSFDLRRDVGIWAGVMAVAHTLIGLNVHLRGRTWLYFVDTQRHLRRDLFGFGNYTGVAAALLFVLLLALSNDLSIRKLGYQRWKALQRWTYLAAVLTAAHAIAYQHIEKRILVFEGGLYAVLGTILISQFAGVLKARFSRLRPNLSDQAQPDRVE